MLLRIVRFVSSGRFFAGLAGIWLCSLAWMVHRGWELEEPISTPHGAASEWDLLSVHRTPTFVFLTLLLTGWVTCWFKHRARATYGVVEIGIGLIGGFLTMSEAPFDELASWLALVFAAYVIVRGAENVAMGLEKPSRASEPS
jgi:hypothetical protein